MRFNYEEDDFKDEDFPDVDNSEGELNEEYIEILHKRELIEALKLQIVQKEVNLAILSKTVRHLEKSWFWRFKSFKKKLNLIVETYQVFKALIDIDIAQYQEEEEKESE